MNRQELHAALIEVAKESQLADGGLDLGFDVPEDFDPVAALDAVVLALDGWGEVHREEGASWTLHGYDGKSGWGVSIGNPWAEGAKHSERHPLGWFYDTEDGEGVA